MNNDARALAERFEERPPQLTPARSPVRYATVAIIVACVVMYLVQSALTSRTEGSLLAVGALQGRWVLAGHPEALLSYAFLHGGILHIAMNMSALYSVGSALETIVGARRTLVAFTLSALGGGLAILFLKPDQLVVGASAGIFGIMTALFGISLRRSDLPANVRTRLRRSLGATLLLNLFISLLPNVSLLGHAGGAVAGFVLGASGALSPKRSNTLATALAIACVVALAASVLVALARGQWLRS